MSAALPPPLPYVVRRPLAWRRNEAGLVEMENLHDGSIVRFHAWTESVLRGVERGDDYATLSEAWREEAGPTRELRARRFVLGLHHMGHVDIPLEAPEVFAGRYRRVQEAGRGGMGVAYVCEDLEQPAARLVVKRAWSFLHPQELAEDALRSEADALARLDHPGIPRLRASFYDGGAFHLVRDYVEGRDLRAHLRNPLAAAEARALVAQAADLVAHLHARGLLLLDLGPGNFLQGPDGRLRLLDLGLARAFDGTLRLDAPVGAAGFVAPETLRDHIADPRSEVWALGALYAFLRTGAQPSRRARLDALVESLEPEDAALVARLSADDPAARPPSAPDAAAWLRG